ncbi:hypothetical protein [Streptomyces sp. KLOTTS4A1]|uniref:hypothetical protein n=1 Tax=Streptomyces sp. KLOTTS4A1 TaxID=3390996 RepID=UPI0039F534EE
MATRSPARPLQGAALPKLSELSAPQIRGRACVWCSIILAAGNAVDLGPQHARRAGMRFAWFPRACNDCHREAAQ